MTTPTSTPITTTGPTRIHPARDPGGLRRPQRRPGHGRSALRRRVPVETVQITGTGLRSVEYITGRLTRGRAAARGALSGLWFGLLFTLLFALFLPGPAFGLLFGAPLFAAVWGAVFGFVGHWSTRGQRDFSSISGFQAEQFEVTVTTGHIDRARQLIAAPGSN